MPRKNSSAQYPSKKSKSKVAQRNYPTAYDINISEIPLPIHKPNLVILRPKTENQALYIDAIRKNQLIFGIGPAGTGKTYVPLMMACDELDKKHIDKIYLSRPAEEAGESFGFLPGTLEEKYDPYLRPFTDALIYRYGKSHFEYLIKSGIIEPRPLAFLRGTTLDKAWIILDEAQNTSPDQMQMFLTRLGDSCKAIVSGDLRQSDIKGTSGLADAISCTKSLKGVQVITFTMDDIVRGGLCQDIVFAYAKRFEPTTDIIVDSASLDPYPYGYHGHNGHDRLNGGFKAALLTDH